jgi:hypothetical protein
MLWAQLENIPDKVWYIGGAVVGVVFLLMIVRAILSSKTGHDPDRGLGENLGEFPPPPHSPKGSRRLTVNGLAVRLRLVVVSPTGKQHGRMSPDEVGEMLDDLVRGISEVVEADKPRIKVWPPQLSQAGFAPTFHRQMTTPDPKGAKSRWVLAAGVAKVGGKPLLLGLALLADTPTKLGQLTLDGTEWAETLRIER